MRKKTDIVTYGQYLRITGALPECDSTMSDEQRQRTSVHNHGPGFNSSVVIITWPTREKMAQAIRKQRQREHRFDDYRALVKLKDGEGF